MPFTATYMKGRGNYLCLHRFESFREGAKNATLQLFGESAAQIFLPIIDEWSKQTETGDRAEIADLPEDLPFWGEIAATSENCIGTECPRYTDCFVTRMRSRAAESNLVVVNHHLLCADAAVRQSAYGEVIPECSYAVVDEAHQLEDVATQYFGVSVSNYRFDELVRDGERVIAAGAAGDKAPELREALDRAKRSRPRFFRSVGSNAPSRTQQASDNRVRVTAKTLEPFYEDAALVMSALDLLEATAALIKPPPPDPDRPQDAAEDGSRRACRIAPANCATNCGSSSARTSPTTSIFWKLEAAALFLRAAPIDVSGILRDVLFDRMKATVLTSATLTVDGTFDYVRSRLGLEKSGRGAIREAAVRVRLPAAGDSVPAAADARSALVGVHRRGGARDHRASSRRRRGRAFVLFTSYAALRAVQAIAEIELPYPILVQGSAPRSALLEQFRTTPNAVLLATSSFWQGVDVMGDALSCVIIDKLPFASPGDPITAARIEAIADRGGQPFGDYQVPLAILALLQGLGRLIRHRDDRGVLAVLDPRLQTMGYGRRFLASLPPAGITREIARHREVFRREIERFGLSCKLFSAFPCISTSS